MRYVIVPSKQYRKAFKKIKNDKKLIKDLDEVIELLASDTEIPKEYKDHRLVGNLKDFRELHIRPDLLLVYQKEEDLLILLLVNLGSHSDLF